VRVFTSGDMNLMQQIPVRRVHFDHVEARGERATGRRAEASTMAVIWEGVSARGTG
jgi:hypothetical protein